MYIDEFPPDDPIRIDRENRYPDLDIKWLRKSLQSTNLSVGSRALFEFYVEDYARWEAMRMAAEVAEPKAETKFVESGAQVQEKLL
jgi:hypothetical protein